MKQELKVGDIVRIKEAAYKPWALKQTQSGDMVIVKRELLAYQVYRAIVERADGDCFTAVYAGGEIYDYQQEQFAEDDLVLIEGRRF